MTYAGSKVITLASTFVLARLLTPTDFGTVALAFLTINVLAIFRDLGLGAALVVRQDLDRRAQGTVLGLMLGMGFLLTVIVAALAPAAADVFDDPTLEDILPPMALTLLMGSYNWFYEVILQRELEFSRRFVAVIAMSVAQVVVSITLAALGAGVWSLVAGWLASWATQAVAVTALAPYRVRPRLDRAVARDVIGTSRGFLAQGALTFVQQNADFLAVGRVLGSAQLGLYTMAFRLSEVPYWAVADPAAKVTFPSFARMRHAGEDVTPSFLAALRLIALVCVPLGLLLSAVAEPFTEVVFGAKWSGMTGALSVLGLWAALRPLVVTIEWMLSSVGQQGLVARLAAMPVLLSVPILFVAADGSGITAVAWVVVAAAAVTAIAMVWAVRARCAIPARDIGRAVWPAVAGAAPAWLSAWVVAKALAGAPSTIALAAAVLAGAVAYTALASLAEPGVLRAASKQVGRMFGRSLAAAPGGP